jgi:hypothetical protein
LVDVAVSDFQNFDADSQAFRYPIDCKGKQSLKGLEQINLQHFSQQMEKIAEFLDAAAMGISAYLDAMNDGQY